MIMVLSDRFYVVLICNQCKEDKRRAYIIFIMLRVTSLYLITMEELLNEEHALLTNIYSWLALEPKVHVYFTYVVMNENMQKIASSTFYHLFADIPYQGGRVPINLGS
jgi:hypothetical protein